MAHGHRASIGSWQNRFSAAKGRDVVVLGLPRGGVPVAAEVARALGAPLDVIIVRKLGVPSQPELAVGAVGEDGVLVVNERVARRVHLSEAEFAAMERRGGGGAAPGGVVPRRQAEAAADGQDRGGGRRRDRNGLDRAGGLPGVARPRRGVGGAGDAGLRAPDRPHDAR
jgi:hypothetical protein